MFIPATLKYSKPLNIQKIPLESHPVAKINNLSRKPVPVMWSSIINIWTNGNDTEGIDSRMASIVMQLYMFHVYCATNARNLEDVFGIIEEVWVFP